MDNICDRCVARAVSIVTTPNGLTLRFCGHHTDQHAPALRSSGATIADERERVPVTV